MKKYESVELELVKLGDDVIVTSGGIIDDSGEGGWFPDV